MHLSITLYEKSSQYLEEEEEEEGDQERNKLQVSLFSSMYGSAVHSSFTKSIYSTSILK
jgi:hypothetical protein